MAQDKRPWKQNGVVVFDTSFVHETGNESEEERYVLIIDFWHPDLTKVLINRKIGDEGFINVSLCSHEYMKESREREGGESIDIKLENVCV